jgi:hypothetical protein
MGNVIQFPVERTRRIASIWWNGTSAGFEADQKARIAVFDRIKPGGNWKEPIDAWIGADQFEECNQAAVFFTGGPIRIVEEFGDSVRVIGEGYYYHIGA